MLVFDLTEFQERFEELVEMAAAGESFEVYNNGVPLVSVKAVDVDDDMSAPNLP